MNIFPIGDDGKSCWDIGLGTTGARCDIGTDEGTICGFDPARALDRSILYAGCVSITYSTSLQRCTPPGDTAGRCHIPWRGGTPRRHLMKGRDPIIPVLFRRDRNRHPGWVGVAILGGPEYQASRVDAR